MTKPHTTHWPDGTPRSTGNVFDVLYSTAPSDQHPARLPSAARILRDNRNHSFCTTIPTAADNAKTARIKGRL